ncbi:MAG: hypothetical protein ABEJ61_09885 [Haloferacaceae archaeon]
MTGRTHAGDPALLFRLLVAYRLLFYLGGLLAMSAPLVVAWTFGVELPRPVRTTVVAVSFVVILLTYLAERRVGLDHVDPATGAPTERYSARLRASVVLAIVGVALGVYLLLRGRVPAALLFVGGALLFFQLAYRSEGATEGTGD